MSEVSIYMHMCSAVVISLYTCICGSTVAMSMYTCIVAPLLLCLCIHAYVAPLLLCLCVHAYVAPLLSWHMQENVGILTHLVNLDLSNNHLQSLPESFGNLISLQKLDLYSNQLSTLPLSFWHLKKLRWLDLKKNPLEKELEDAAGTCVSVEGCTKCASQVCMSVVYVHMCDVLWVWFICPGVGLYEATFLSS